ncbi:MAG TPA: TolC family protein [Vicinamibacterales bacterium]|nr:TolC family protein [Vicinamibacterales bacterium]
MTQHSSRRFRSIALIAALATIAVPALSAKDQQLSLQAPAQATPPPAAQGPTLQLSMEQAVTMGLESNLGLKAQRLEIDIAAEGIAGARAAFLPQLFSSFNRTSSESVPQSFTEGSSDISSRRMNASGTWRQALRWYGGDYNLTWSSNRNSQIGGTSSFNPSLGSTVTMNFTQPLLRDLRIDPNRAALETSERVRAISDVQLQQRVVSTEADIRFAYLNLIGAIEGRKVQLENMTIAEQTLANARASVAVGQAPEINIVQAQAEVESRRETLLRSEVQILTMEDNLRTLVLDPARPDYWDVHIEPTDKIQLTPREIDLNAAIKSALANRLDLVVVRRNLEITDLNIRVTKNSTTPAMDFGVTYSATGTGGTQLEFGEGFPPPILSRTDKSFGSVLGDTFGGAYPTWTVGVQVAYPLGHSAAHASLAQQEIRKRQDLLSLRDLELQIVRDVRDAARFVQNSYQRVLASRAALDASEKQLEAENRKFAAGVSTTLELQVRQGQLASARVNALQAEIDYNRALITFDRVQKTR